MRKYVLFVGLLALVGCSPKVANPTSLDADAIKQSEQQLKDVEAQERGQPSE